MPTLVICWAGYGLDDLEAQVQLGGTCVMKIGALAVWPELSLLDGMTRALCCSESVPINLGIIVIRNGFGNFRLERKIGRDQTFVLDRASMRTGWGESPAWGWGARRPKVMPRLASSFDVHRREVPMSCRCAISGRSSGWIVWGL